MNIPVIMFVFTT